MDFYNKLSLQALDRAKVWCSKRLIVVSRCKFFQLNQFLIAYSVK